MNSQPSYIDYYLPVIEQHPTGLKYVYGGTGLGKTSGLVAAIQAAPPERKFLYIANRVQLLEEMHTQLKAAGIQHLQQRNDTEMLYRVIRTQRGTLEDFLRLPVVERHAAAVLLTDDIQSIRKLCHDITQLLHDEKLTPVFKDMLGSHAGTVMSFLKRVITEISLKAAGEYERVISHPVVTALFPYIAFRRNPGARVLLLTLQKAFHGVFNGRGSIDISMLQDAHGGYVIFLDEFDFLENTLAELICRDGQISHPFKFVEAFYRAMKQHKLPEAAYLEGTLLRQQIEGIIDQIDTLRTSALRYPDINQFTALLPDLTDVTIFTTTHTILTEDVVVHPSPRSFHLIPAAQAAPQDATLASLVAPIHYAMMAVLRCLKDLDVRDPQLYREIVHQCFEATIFATEIKAMRQSLPAPTPQRSDFAALLEHGYGVYDLHDLQHTTDQAAVALVYYGMATTPERILRDLARNNLVFGLSATADIPRTVRGFSTAWLHQELGPGLLAVTEDDYALIGSLNVCKQQARGNQVTVEKVSDLLEPPPGAPDLHGFIQAIANEAGFGGDDRGGYRRRRLARFFATLDWVAARTPHHGPETHLLFFNSYRQIKHVFTNHADPEDDLFFIQPLEPHEHRADLVFQAYTITYAGLHAVVLFYDAAQGQRINSDALLQERYQHLFALGFPVLIVTTYPSAGNGINLQYRDAATGTDHDIQHVHLLDSPYFYFGQPESTLISADRRAMIKQSIWYVAKLFESGMLDEPTFKSMLRSVRGTGLNARYHADLMTRSDSILNQLATFIQALGRVERVWSSMPDQTIRLSREVFEIFEIFCTREQYASLRQQREPLLSNNLRQVFAQIQQLSRVEGKRLRRSGDERLQAQNQRCHVALDALVEQLRAVRSGQADATVRATWTQLRQAVLMHDTSSALVTRYACWFATPWMHDGRIAIDWDTLTVYPPDVWSGDLAIWDMNSAYALIAQNTVLRSAFVQRGYPLGFTDTAGFIPTPHCYQALLLGALGEEAVAAMLTRHAIALQELPDALFEIVDLKLAHAPWYIDCKNYSAATLSDFARTPDDLRWRPKLNEGDFKALAQQKLSTLRAFHGPAAACKLIYINLAAPADHRTTYFDAQFTPVPSWSEADIIVVPGLIDSSQPQELHPSMQDVLQIIHTRLA